MTSEVTRLTQNDVKQVIMRDKKSAFDVFFWLVWGLPVFFVFFLFFGSPLTTDMVMTSYF